jgi:hypothetical protein
MLYCSKSSGAANAIHWLSGEKRGAPSATSRLLVSRSSAPVAALTRKMSPYRFAAVMLRSYRRADCPWNAIHLASSDTVKLPTEKVESPVRRFVVRGSRSSTHKLAIGVSMFRMLTVKRLSRRAFSSASSVSGDAK